MAKLIDQLDEERGKNIELESLRNQRLQFFSRTSIWRRDMRLASQEPTSRVLSPLARVFIIHQERPDGKLQYTYSPFIKTLLAGFKTLDVAVKLVKADRNSAEGRKGGLEKKLLLQKLRKDDVLVLVGSQEPSFQDDYVQIANSVKVKRGLFTVLYQTETLLLGRPGAFVLTVGRPYVYCLFMCCARGFGGGSGTRGCQSSGMIVTSALMIFAIAACSKKQH
eukprot:jgi/Bigna1/78605/fgenesh1_pg.55_\